MTITKEQLYKAIPDAKRTNIDKYYEPLVNVMSRYEINNKRRIAMFLANIAHESQVLSRVTENLNYSAQGLKKTFPKYFRTVNAANYHRQPQKIASYVYANRMGNGSVASGDGWTYRGRGLIQITGKDNYKECGKDLGVDLLKDPSYLETPIGAAMSAGWYWDKRNLNVWADKGDLKEVTRRINGGLNGYEDRSKRYNRILQVL